jgi:hypothetical protein
MVMPHRIRFGIQSLILLTSLAAACGGDPQGPSLIPDGNLVDITAVAYGTQFVAVGVDMQVSGNTYVPGGDLAVVGRSDDATVWEWSSIGVQGALLTVGYGNGIYVAGGVRVSSGGSASGFLLRSTDGSSWQEVAVPSATAWNSVAWGNDIFLATAAVGSFGTILARSADGMTWEGIAETSMPDAMVAFADGRFHVTGSAGAIYSSLNGDSWATRSVAEVNRIAVVSEIAGGIAASAFLDPGSSSAPQNFFTITGGGEGPLEVNQVDFEGFILRYAEGNDAIAGLSPQGLLRSDDLADWTVTAVVQHPAELQDLVFAAGRFVAVGRGAVRTSSDGAAWSSIAVPDAVADR